MTTLSETLAEVLAGDLPAKKGFMYNAAQCDYAQAVLSVLQSEKGSTGFIEGDTGIGKSFGYLLALVLWMRQKKKSAVYISTHSRQLQSQLLDVKNIAILNELLEARGMLPVLPVMRVGRSNYISPQRLADVLDVPSLDDLKVSTLPIELQRLVKLATTGSGSLLDYPGVLPEGFDQESIGLVPHEPDTQQYAQMLERADHAEIVVVNHALLVNLLRNGVMDSPGLALLIDEAEHFPDVAQSVMSVGFSFSRFYQILKRYQVSGLGSYWNDNFSTFCNRDQAGEVGSFQADTLEIYDEVRSLLESVDRIKRSKSRIIKQYGDGAWSEIEELVTASGHIGRNIDSERLAFSYSPVRGMLTVREPRIDAGRIIHKGLKERRTIFTSATLSDLDHINPSFQHIQRLLGIYDPTLTAAFSPERYGAMTFRFPEETSVTGAPIEKEGEAFRLSDEYASHVLNDMNQNPLPYGARRLLLCRSYRDVEILKRIQESESYPGPIYYHDSGTRLRDVVDRLVANEEGGTLVTPAGWEGLSPSRINNKPFWHEVGVLRLPFSPPDMLREHALATHLSRTNSDLDDKALASMSTGVAWAEDRNKMLHQLRQGFGRLIRHQNDKGTIVIYDPRFPRPWETGRQYLVRAIPFRFRHEYRMVKRRERSEESTIAALL